MMIDHLPKQLEAWHDFYLVVGTGAAALTGLLFVIVSLGPHVVANRTRTGESTLPLLDWIWFVGLPIVCYVLILASGVAIAMSLAMGLFAMASTMLLLVVVGIRNAWDVVLWVAQLPRPEPTEKKAGQRRRPG